MVLVLRVPRIMRLGLWNPPVAFSYQIEALDEPGTPRFEANLAASESICRCEVLDYLAIHSPRSMYLYLPGTYLVVRKSRHLKSVRGERVRRLQGRKGIFIQVTTVRITYVRHTQASAVRLYEYR